MPLAVSVNQVDEIAAIIRFKQQLDSSMNSTGIVRLILIGGAEAWMIPDVLANQIPPVGVVLDDFTINVAGGSFENWNAIPNAASILRASNIPVAFTSLDGSGARNLRWIAATATAEGLSYTDALSSITRTPATLFYGQSTTEGTIAVGNAANFVAFSGDPLSYQSTVELVVIKGNVGCQPKQF